jgi:hypothetical protein
VAQDNPLRGYRRIYDEINQVGVTVAQSTGWEFLRNACGVPEVCLACELQ